MAELLSPRLKVQDISTQVLGPLMNGYNTLLSPKKTKDNLISHAIFEYQSNNIALEKQLDILLEEYRQHKSSDDLAFFARRYGIPPEFRKIVWPILLNSHPLRGSIPTNERHAVETVQLLKNIRTEIGKQRRNSKRRDISPPSSSPPLTGPMSYIDDAAYLALVNYFEQHPGAEFTTGMVNVCLTLAEWVIDENYDYSQQEVLCTCFERIMQIMLWTPEWSKQSSTQYISEFLTYFKKLLPDLAQYFNKEQVGNRGDEWVYNWVRWWCATELRKDERARLWDWYLGWRSGCEAMMGSLLNDPASLSCPTEWHLFVCLALLRHCKDALEEMEGSEIRGLLKQLPRISDIEGVMLEAGKMQEEMKNLDAEDEAAYSSSASRSL